MIEVPTTEVPTTVQMAAVPMTVPMTDVPTTVQMTVPMTVPITDVQMTVQMTVPMTEDPATEGPTTEVQTTVQMTEGPTTDVPMTDQMSGDTLPGRTEFPSRRLARERVDCPHCGKDLTIATLAWSHRCKRTDAVTVQTKLDGMRTRAVYSFQTRAPKPVLKQLKQTGLQRFQK